MATFIVVLSVVIQFSTAFYSFWLIRITGLRYAWLLMSSAFFLMGCRRAVVLLHITGDPAYAADVPNEIIGASLSFILLLGVMRIGPIFMERKQAEEKILRLLKIRETLINEIFHRTRNIMQMIRGLILLQAAEFFPSDDVRRLIKITEDRIQAIALVHDKLYQSRNISHIPVREYVDELCRYIFTSRKVQGKTVSMELDMENRNLILDVAVPLGLILNELINNSLEHAFPDGKSGNIRISFRTDESGNNQLLYTDDGIGTEETIDYENPSTLGFQLIRTIALKQLSGYIDFRTGSGFSCFISFPDNLYSLRIHDEE
jgi:two-component sensor histidine kinase